MEAEIKRGKKEPEQPVLQVTTQMERKDYRRFLYLATFCRNHLVIPLLFIVAAIGALAVAYQEGGVKWSGFITAFGVYCVLCFGAVALLVEFRNRQHAKGNTLGFGQKQVYEFYEDRLVTYTPEDPERAALLYGQMYRVLESRRYLIFYCMANLAFLLRREDLSDAEWEQLTALLRQAMGKRYRRV